MTPAPCSRHRVRSAIRARARRENHVHLLIPLPQQLDYLQSAGFLGIDVHCKHLDNVVYGVHRQDAKPRGV